jgi:hypothetical protein
MGIDHFGCKYGEKLDQTGGVEFAPKFEFDKLEEENKGLREVYEPMTQEHRELRTTFKTSQVTYNRLKANMTLKQDVSSTLPNNYLSFIDEKEVRKPTGCPKGWNARGLREKLKTGREAT